MDDVSPGSLKWMLYRACKCWWTVSYQWMMNCGPFGMTCLFIEFASYIIRIQGPTVYLPTKMMKVSQTNFSILYLSLWDWKLLHGTNTARIFFLIFLSMILYAYHGTVMLSERFPWFVVAVSWQPDAFPKVHPIWLLMLQLEKLAIWSLRLTIAMLGHLHESWGQGQGRNQGAPHPPKNDNDFSLCNLK